MLKSSTLSNGSGSAQSVSYRLKSTIGQPITGNAASSSFRMQSGFEAMVAVDQIADLAFEGSTTLNPASVDRGGQLDVFFKIKNNGTVDIETGVVINAFLSGNSVYDEGDTELPPAFTLVNRLDAGGSIDKTASGLKVTIPSTSSPGSYYLLLVLDRDGLIKERNETNNVASVSIAITADQIAPTVLPLSSEHFMFTAGGSVSVTVTDNKAVKEVRFIHRSITATTFDSTLMNVNGSNYSIPLQDGWGDVLGTEGYFFATDFSGNKANSASHYYWYRAADPNATIPFASAFGGKTDSYEMFSIPFNVDSKVITSIFDELSDGEYDKSRWRVYHYEDGTNRESATMTIEPGLGYWINMAEKTPVRIGTGQVVQANQATPRELTLQPGWNQIGNPYPFDIKWSAVVGVNENVSELNFWEGGSYSDDRDLFRAWEGAFVFNSNPAAIKLPVPLDARTSSRTKSDDLPQDIDGDEWVLNLKLVTGRMGHSAGVGMHPSASQTKDKYDKITPPGLSDYVDMHVHHAEFFVPRFATDIVPTSDEFTWTFDVKTNLEGERAELSWENQPLEHAASSLVLIDVSTQSWVDMTTSNHYSFNHKEGRQLRVLFNRSGDVNPGVTLLGDAYPNSFANSVTIPLLVGGDNLVMSVGVYNTLGQRVRTLSSSFMEHGMHALTWDGHDDSGNEVSDGMLFYRIETGGSFTQTKRMIKSSTP